MKGGREMKITITAFFPAKWYMKINSSQG